SRRARRGSGRRAWFCCNASASASMRSSLRCRGFKRSQRRRLLLRLRPSQASADSTERPVEGSGGGGGGLFIGWIIGDSCERLSGIRYQEAAICRLRPAIRNRGCLVRRLLAFIFLISAIGYQ